MSEQTLIKEVQRLEDAQQALLDEQRRDAELAQRLQRANDQLEAKRAALFEVKLAAAQKQLDKFRQQDEVPLFERLGKIADELGKLGEDAEAARKTIEETLADVRRHDPFFGKGSIEELDSLAGLAWRFHQQFEVDVARYRERISKLAGYGVR